MKYMRRVFDKISQSGGKHIFTSIVVACELRSGAQKKASSQLTLKRSVDRTIVQ